MILLAVLTFFTGCSLCPTQIKTEFVQTKPFKFIIIDVNVTKVKKTKPFSLAEKISFTNSKKTAVKISVETWVKLREINAKRVKANKRLRLHKLMLRKALDAVNKQIKKYMDYVNENRKH